MQERMALEEAKNSTPCHRTCSCTSSSRFSRLLGRSRISTKTPCTTASQVTQTSSQEVHATMYFKRSLRYSIAAVHSFRWCRGRSYAPRSNAYPCSNSRSVLTAYSPKDWSATCNSNRAYISLYIANCSHCSNSFISPAAIVRHLWSNAISNVLGIVSVSHVISSSGWR